MYEYAKVLQFSEYFTTLHYQRLCAILTHMNRTYRIIFTVSAILLAAELAIMLISILSTPLSDIYLRVWGIIVLITACIAIFSFIQKRKGE